MNILLLSPLPPPSGGIARWTQRYIEWTKDKHNVTIVNTALMGERAGVAGKQRKILDEVKRANYVIQETRRKLKYKPDIVHINTSCSKLGILRDWICMRLAYKSGFPIITHCHCNIEDQLGNGILATKLFVDMVRKSRKVLVLNLKSKQYVDRIELLKSILCPNFILASQIAEFHPTKQQIEKVVYVGDVRLSKGSDDLYTLAYRNPNITFIVVGSVTDEMACIEKPQNVLTLGRLESDEVERQLDDADVFLFPSVTEGFSNALLEAMARGLPAIATSVGAAMDMIESGGGIIVQVHDINAMQCALAKMESPEIRKAMSAWNIGKVKRCYEYDLVLKKIFDIYEENR